MVYICEYTALQRRRATNADIVLGRTANCSAKQEKRSEGASVVLEATDAVLQFTGTGSPQEPTRADPNNTAVVLEAWIGNPRTLFGTPQLALWRNAKSLF